MSSFVSLDGLLVFWFSKNSMVIVFLQEWNWIFRMVKLFLWSSRTRNLPSATRLNCVGPRFIVALLLDICSHLGFLVYVQSSQKFNQSFTKRHCSDTGIISRLYCRENNSTTLLQMFVLVKFLSFVRYRTTSKFLYLQILLMLLWYN